MNNKSKTEKTEISVGQRLLQEREKLGLSREIVAERLCLKVCTVREIEEDNNPHNLDPTFLRGYIRSYAKLVKIPEKEIIELLDKHILAKVAVVFPMQSYSLGKAHKTREGWIIKFTWLIIIICIAMVGIWWWQGYKIQKQEIATMAEENRTNTTQIQENLTFSPPAKLAEIKKNNLNTSLTESTVQPVTSLTANNVVSTNHKTSLIAEAQKNSNVSINIGLINPSEVKIPALLDNINNNNLERNKTSIVSIDTDVGNIKFNDRIMMNFKGECWLEVRDAQDKILFTGIKHAGQKLELSGALPYQFNIGMPININLLFKGKSVDLNRFIKANRPAKFKLPGL